MDNNLSLQDLQEELNRIKAESVYEKNKLQTLLDISSGLYESKSFEEMGMTISVNLKKFKLNENFGIKIAVYDRHIDEYRVIYLDDILPQYKNSLIIPQPPRLSLQEVKFYSRVALDQRKTLLINDNHSEFSLSIDPRQKDHIPQSMIFIPLVYKDLLVGLFSLSRSPENSLDDNFVEYLESICHFLCLAIGELLNTIQQERIKDELARERNLFNTIINIFPADEIYVKDLEGRVTFFNDVILKNMQIKPNELLGKTDYDFMPKDIADIYAEEEREIIRSGVSMINHEIEYLDRFNRKSALLVNKAILKDNFGKPIGIVGLNHDISDFKRKVEELRALQGISHGLFTAKTFEDIGRTVFANLNQFRISEFIFGKLAVYDMEEDMYSVEYNIGIENNELVEVPPVDDANYPCTLKDVINFSKIALQEKRTLIIQDNQSDYAKSVFCSDKDFSYAMIFIPLLYKNKIVGLLNFARAPKNSMDPEFVAYLESLSNYVSITIGELLNEKKKLKFQSALIENEERYRTLVETSPDAIVLFNIDDKIILCNHNVTELFDIKNPEEISNITFLDLVSSEYREFALENKKLLLEKGYRKNIEYLLIKSDQSSFPAEVSFRLIYDSSGKPDRYMGIIRDISERKRSEAELNHTRALLEAAFDQSESGIIVISVSENRIIVMNKTAQNIFGIDDVSKYLEVDLSEINKSWKDIKPDGSEFPEDELPINRVCRGIKSINLEECIIRYDETKKWILVNATPIYNKKGEIAAGFVIFSDITDLKKTERSLEQEKERLAVTLRSIGDGVITTDINGDIVMINKVAEELTGWSQDEAFSKPLSNVFNIIHEVTREKCENPVEKVLRTGQTISLANHTALISKDGIERNIADSGSPIVNGDGKIEGVVLVFRDVTEKQKTEHELSKIQKLESIGVLAGGIAHDFNNILTSIIGNISIAKKNIMNADKERILDIFKKIEKASFRARDLTQQLLTFSKGGSPILKSGSLKNVLEDSIHFTLRGSNIKCNLIESENIWPVEMDEGQISQVIQNLTINAEQAMPSGGIITAKIENIEIQETKNILCLIPGKYVMVSIQDQGIGIPKEYLNKIFDPYFTTKQKGSGLGLASAFSIISKHNGNILVESKIGVGSNFTFYLPASEDDKDKVKKDDSDNIIKKGEGNILILDDEESIRETLTEMVKELGYNAESVADGNEVLVKYKNSYQSGKPYDFVITDLTIPGGLGGKETIDALLLIDPLAKVIASSGYSNNPVMSEYWKYGFCAIITKPYGIEEVSKVLDELSDN